MTMIYKPRPELRPHGLNGISDEQIAQHWALYEGYVKNVNLLNERIKALSVEPELALELAELTRRAGFEYNGMILHEHYFGILKAGRPSLGAGSRLSRRLDECFGSFGAWKKRFTAMGYMRGTGWVILYHDPRRNTLGNFWITSHEDGHPAGFTPIVVMDVWEHAYMVDRGASGRPDYIEKFLDNIDWGWAEKAYLGAAPSDRE